MSEKQIILSPAENTAMPQQLATEQLGSEPTVVTHLLYCSLRLTSFEAEHAPRVVQQLEASNIQRQAETILDDLRDKL